ncbi:MAG: hypothetical protein ACKD6N_07560 [Candidatus Bathyarchaeota archaeon]
MCRFCESGELKAKFFALLREDVEFRYAVAGLLGFEEILRRMDKHKAELVKLREDVLLDKNKLERLSWTPHHLGKQVIRKTVN